MPPDAVRITRDHISTHLYKIIRRSTQWWKFLSKRLSESRLRLPATRRSLYALQSKVSLISSVSSATKCVTLVTDWSTIRLTDRSEKVVTLPHPGTLTVV